jgi:hypothetical protein
LLSSAYAMLLSDIHTTHSFISFTSIFRYGLLSETFPDQFFCDPYTSPTHTNSLPFSIALYLLTLYLVIYFLVVLGFELGASSFIGFILLQYPLFPNRAWLIVVTR